MTSENIKEHALNFLKNSKYISLDTMWDIETDIREYTRKNKHLFEFKYQDKIEVEVLRTFLVEDGYIIFLDKVRDNQYYKLTEKGLEYIKARNHV